MNQKSSTLLGYVNAFTKPESDTSLPKFNADEYNKFKVYLKTIKILNKEVVSHSEFYKMCIKELHHKNNDHQALKKETDEMRVKESKVLGIWR